VLAALHDFDLRRCGGQRRERDRNGHTVAISRPDAWL
jgi:hypothetical protein